MARQGSFRSSELTWTRDARESAAHRTKVRLSAWASRLAGSLALLALLCGPVSAQWRQGGIPVSSSAASQYSPCAVSDGQNGAYVAWLDMRTPASIRVQHVRQDGRVVDEVSFVEEREQRHPRLHALHDRDAIEHPLLRREVALVCYVVEDAHRQRGNRKSQVDHRQAENSSEHNHVTH